MKKSILGLIVSMLMSGICFAQDLSSTDLLNSNIDINQIKDMRQLQNAMKNAGMSEEIIDFVKEKKFGEIQSLVDKKYSSQDLEPYIDVFDKFKNEGNLDESQIQEIMLYLLEYAENDPELREIMNNSNLTDEEKCLEVINSFINELEEN